MEIFRQTPKHTIYCIKNLLTPEQCAELIILCAPYKGHNKVADAPELAQKFWEFIHPISDKIFFDDKTGKHFTIKALTNKITITRTNHQYGKHIDTKIEGSNFKLFAYLNNLSEQGGTEFYENGEKYLEIQNKAGNAVLFHTDLEHGGQPIPEGELKHLIGCRPIVEYLD